MLGYVEERERLIVDGECVLGKRFSIKRDRFERKRLPVQHERTALSRRIAAHCQPASHARGARFELETQVRTLDQIGRRLIVSAANGARLRIFHGDLQSIGCFTVGDTRQASARSST